MTYVDVTMLRNSPMKFDEAETHTKKRKENR
jgi:hypothetical protein